MTEKKNNKTDFIPKIVSFVCNWSANIIIRNDEFSFPTNIHFIRLMCLGRINHSFILNAFESGADGVILLGCPPGDCHYYSGNDLVDLHFNETVKLLHLLGIKKERLSLMQCSVTEDLKFVKNVQKSMENMRKLGPSPLNEKR